MSHTDPHQTTNLSQHVPPLMTINVNSAHPFVHTHKKQPHTKPLLLEWHLNCSIDVHFFSQYIQSKCILQYFLELYYYFRVLLFSLKPFKMFFMVLGLLSSFKNLNLGQTSDLQGFLYSRVLNVIWKSLLETLNRKGFLSQFESALKTRPYISR